MMDIHKYTARAWRALYGWATHRLYNEFAWTYDAVSWSVSRGRWDDWRKEALAHVQGTHVLEIGFGTGVLLLEIAATHHRASLLRPDRFGKPVRPKNQYGKGAS